MLAFNKLTLWTKYYFFSWIYILFFFFYKCWSVTRSQEFNNLDKQCCNVISVNYKHANITSYTVLCQFKFLKTLKNAHAFCTLWKSYFNMLTQIEFSTYSFTQKSKNCATFPFQNLSIFSIKTQMIFIQKSIHKTSLV